jgi:LEA14-like dessication related protein
MVTFNEIERGKIEDKKIDFKVKLVLVNPNFYALKIKPTVLDIMIDGNPMGKIYLNEKVKLRRKTEQEYAVPLSFKLEKGTLMSLVTLGLRDQIEIQVKGPVKGGVLFLYKEFPFDYKKSIAPKELINLK